MGYEQVTELKRHRAELVREVEEAELIYEDMAKRLEDPKLEYEQGLNRETQKAAWERRITGMTRLGDIDAEIRQYDRTHKPYAIERIEQENQQRVLLDLSPRSFEKLTEHSLPAQKAAEQAIPPGKDLTGGPGEQTKQAMQDLERSDKDRAPTYLARAAEEEFLKKWEAKNDKVRRSMQELTPNDSLKRSR